MSDQPAQRGLRSDPWQALTRRTPARVALGRAGGSLPTAELLRFALDHAEARDAVHAKLDIEAIAAELDVLEHDVFIVSSRSKDHADYLRFPDRGRQLNEASAKLLTDYASLTDGPPEIAIVLGDGLSATALKRGALPLLKALLPRLRHYRLSPLILAMHARVAIQDDIGAALRARSAIIILGERPGLGTADSLGAYLVFDPKPGNTDAQRNCISNIRPAGLPAADAAGTIAHLLEAALSRQISGVQLKDDRPAALP